MSVINKMLRDLDARKGSASALQRPDEQAPDVARGASAVGLGIRSPRQRGVSPWLLGLLAVALMGSAGWYWVADELLLGPPAQTLASAQPSAVAVASQTAALVPPAALASTAPASVGETAAVAAPAPQASSSVAPQAPAQGEPTRSPPRLEPSLRMDAALHSAPATAARKVPAPAGRVQPAAPQLDSLAGEPKAALPEPAAVSEPKPRGVSASQRQAALHDAMAQAQSLWAAGSHEAALDLMRKAVAMAERDHGHAGAPSVGESLLTPLVRELSRMELAQGRAAAVVQLLTRLEPVLASEADLWAVRGNAAQRLGRYQESEQAYMTALKLRPDEPRWLLGAAVSLAAQGDLVRAAELTEKARAAGPISPDVLAYLRQAGVKLR